MRPPFAGLACEDAKALVTGGDQIQRPLEAHVIDLFTCFVGGLLHQDPHEVVCDDHHRESFVRHVGCPHGEKLHAQRGFDVTEFKFDLPASGIEIGHFRSLVFLSVEQIGDHYHHLLFFRPVLIAEFYIAQCDFIREFVPLCVGQFTSSGAALGFLPHDQTFGGADFLASSPIKFAVPGLMETHENVCFLLSCGSCDEFVGAICSVGEQKITFFDMLQEPRGGAGIVLARIGGYEAFPSTVAEIDHAVDAHDREAAALLLTRRLRVALLVGLGIHELHRTAVDGLERELVPLVHGSDPLFQCDGDPVCDLSKEVLAEVFPSHAITRRASSRRGETAGLIPPLDEPHSFAAGGIGLEDLSQPCPKYRNVAKAALTLGRIDSFQEVGLQNRLKEKGVAADRATEHTLKLSAKRRLNSTRGCGKNGKRKAGQEWLFIHTF